MSGGNVAITHVEALTDVHMKASTMHFLDAHLLCLCPHAMHCNATGGCSNLPAVKVNVHKVIKMRTYLPISHISQSFLDIVSNTVIRGTSSDTPFHTHLSLRPPALSQI